MSVHRLETARPGRANSLNLAFETPGGTIEIGDDGPFFESDLKLGSRPRLIRAKPGYRPIIVLEPPTHELGKAQPALMILENNRLVLDGLDLVVRTPEHAQGPHCLFLLRGGSELTIANCSITIIGPADRSFTLVKMGDHAAGADPPSARTRKVTLSRSYFRGPSLVGVHLAAGAAEVDVSRSVILCGAGSVVASDGSAPPFSRRVFARRSILASHKSLVNASNSPLFIRVLASTLARVGSHDPGPLVSLPEETASNPRDALDWLGYENSYVGWDGFLACGAGAGALKVSDLPAVRAAWEGSDKSSRVSHTPWSESSMGGDRALPDFRKLVPDRLATVGQVGFPRGFLWEKTVGLFDRLKVPAMSRAPMGRGAGSSKAADSAETRVLTFDADDRKWNGDLGRFLAQSLPRGVARVRVAVTGSGSHETTPIRLEPGVSLEIEVAAPAKGLEPLSWTPISGSNGEALIVVRQADLVLANVRLIRGKSSRSSGCWWWKMVISRSHSAT